MSFGSMAQSRSKGLKAKGSTQRLSASKGAPSVSPEIHKLTGDMLGMSQLSNLETGFSLYRYPAT